MTTTRTAKFDLLERMSRVFTLSGFVLALVVSLAAPLLALSWSNRPFAGFLVEQTLVVNDVSSDGWSGRPAGLGYPQRIRRIGGVAVTTSDEFAAAVAAQVPGEQIPVLTETPDGVTRLFPSVTVSEFPAGDMVRLFWLPYLVGLVYLAIGLWIYRASGSTRPGRALAYFCVNTAIVCILLFDLSTTHAAVVVWTAAVAQIGGALITLALRFPVEWKPVDRRPWLLAVPYGASIALVGWGLLVVYNTTRAWDYIPAWGASYRYAALGILFFLGLLVYRTRAGEAAVVRQQARVVLWGSLVAFLPVSVWFLAPLLQLPFAFNAALFLPTLLVFPFAVAVAIRRYRLLEADALVNRTIVYGVLTAILAGVFTAAIGVMQKLFVALTGEKSDAAIVVTTLIVGAAFTPLRKRLDGLVAAQFGQVPETTRDLKQFGEEVRAYTRMTDAEQMAERLLEEAARALGASSGAVRLSVAGLPPGESGGQLRTVHTYGRWSGEAWLVVPLEDGGARYGLLLLGPRANEEPYRREDFEALQRVAAEVARAIHLADVAWGGSGARVERPAAVAEGAGG